MRRFAVLVAAVVAAPPAAAAEPFGELPFHPVAGVATCLRATGAPGELARWVPGGVQLLDAGADGVRAAGSVHLGGRPAGCPAVAAAERGGAAVAAHVTRGGRVEALRVAVRDPGGAFAAPVTIARLHAAAPTSLHVAVGPAGDAVVAVADLALARRSRVRIVAVRRRAGRGFGRPETLSSTPFEFEAVPTVAASMDAAGDATLAWQDGAGTVATASAAPGARFRAPQRLGSSAAPPALAVAPDGRALAVWAASAEVRAAERAPGQARFGPSAVLGDNDASGIDEGTAVALRADGAAVAAWSDGIDVSAVSRRGPGAFSRRVQIARAARPSAFSQRAFATTARARAPIDGEGGQVRAALAGDAFALAWSRFGGIARDALGRLDGTGASPSFPGGRLRPAASTTPVVLAGGTLAVAWADNDGAPLAPTSAGRLHIAVAGARREVDPAPPRISLAAAGRRRRYLDQPLWVPVVCPAACDVKVPGAGTESRPSAGRLRFGIFPGPLRPGPASVPVTIRASGPGGRRPRTLHVRVRELVRRPPPVPAPLDVIARRRGSAVAVSWRVAFAGRDVTFVVAGSRRRGDSNPVAVTIVRGGRAGRFRARLERAARARYVTVDAISGAGGRERPVTVPISG